MNRDLTSRQMSPRIGHRLAALREIAPAARVDQILVLAGTIWGQMLRFVVVKIEVASDPAPLLADEAVDAAEQELVA
jgi:hypothetical protein